MASDRVGHDGRLALRVKHGHALLPLSSACQCESAEAGLPSFDELDLDGDGCLRAAEVAVDASFEFGCVDSGNTTDMRSNSTDKHLTTDTPGCITRHEFRHHNCSARPDAACDQSSRIYNVTIELDNGGEEQEAPDMYARGTALIASPSVEPGLTVSFALPELALSTARSQEAFGVLEGTRALKLVEPRFEVLGPFYQSNPRNTDSLSTTLHFVLQFNVRLTAGSYITFRGFRNIYPSHRRHGSQVTCITPEHHNVASHADWDEEDMSFRVHVLDWLLPRTLYTIRMDVALAQLPDVVERESEVWVDAVVETGRKDSAVRARRARLVVDLGNQPPSFTLVTKTVVVLEDGVVATRLAKHVSPGPPGVDLESESSQQTSFSINVVEAGEGWQPVFRPQQQPRISATGELTFGLALAPDAAPLQEFQSHAFQLEVALHDDGGVEHGGLDTSDLVLVDIVVIGSPQAPPSVSAKPHEPLSVQVSWTSTEEAVQAHLMLPPVRLAHLASLALLLLLLCPPRFSFPPSR